MPARDAVSYAVFVNGAYQQGLRVETIERRVGGSDEIERATLYEDLAYTGGAGLFGYALARPIDLPVTIVTEATGLRKVVHFGLLGEPQYSSDASGQSVRYVSRLAPCHFGEPQRYTRFRATGNMRYFWDEDEARLDGTDLVFNPIVDGKAQRNRGDRSTRAGAYHWFIDYESIRTEKARTTVHLGTYGAFWSLAEIVNHLCWTLNPLQRWITNPTLEELQAILDPLEPFPRTRDLRIAMGTFLPEALTRALAPYGVLWWLELSETQRRFRFAPRYTTPIKELRSQGLGERVDNTRSHVLSLRVGFETSRVANLVEAVGGARVFEGTFELYRGWSEDADIYTPEELQHGETAYDQHPHAWRKWVLNEGGDYNDTREEITEKTNVWEALELTEENATDDLWLAKRRRFEQMLSKWDGDGELAIGETQGIEVEWFDPNDGEEGAWRPASWPVSVGDQECSIRFVGYAPPAEIVDLGDEARVRVTACIRSDSRLAAYWERPGEWVNERQPLLLDVGERFAFRKVAPSSKYFDAVAAGTRQADEVDESEELLSHVQEIAATWWMLEARGEVVLEGIDRDEYNLADQTLGLDGMGLSLALDGYPPHIVAITYDEPRQKTALLLASMSLRESAGSGGVIALERDRR